MSKFAFLLNHAPDRYSSLSEDSAMAIFKDYMEWMQGAAKSGVCDGGYKLSEGPGKIVSSKGGGFTVHESPFAELTEVLGGIMVVNAPDFDAAIEIAKAHPHLVHNQSIEIRQLDGE